MRTHWYVFKRYNGGFPSFRHYSLQSAVDEAKRLLSIHGGEFEILKCEAIVKEAPKYIVERTTDDGDDNVPF